MEVSTEAIILVVTNHQLTQEDLEPVGRHLPSGAINQIVVGPGTNLLDQMRQLELEFHPAYFVIARGTVSEGGREVVQAQFITRAIVVWNLV